MILIRSKVIHIWFWMKVTVLLINPFLKHPMWLHFILYIYSILLTLWLLPNGIVLYVCFRQTILTFFWCNACIFSLTYITNIMTNSSKICLTQPPAPFCPYNYTNCICFCNSINCEDFKIFLWVYLPWSRTPKKLLIAKDLKLKFECSYTVGLHVAKWFFFFNMCLTMLIHTLFCEITIHFGNFYHFVNFCTLT